MKIQQLSIFVENREGRLAQITEVLAAAQIDIRAISVADTSDFGILRLIVNDPGQAVKALKAAGMTVSLTDVIGIGINDRPGEFSKAMRMEYMYAFISRDKGKAFVIIRVDNDEKAMEALRDAGVVLLSAEEIHGM